MPLTWDLTKCEDVDLITSKDERAITDVIIFGTMHTGIGRITTLNAPEFYARMRFIEQLYGDLIVATINGKRVERPLMPLDIQRRIGLATNAAYKDETRASFVKRHITNGFLRDGIYRFNQAVKGNFEGPLDRYVEPADDVAAG